MTNAEETRKQIEACSLVQEIVGLDFFLFKVLQNSADIHSNPNKFQGTNPNNSELESIF